MQGLLIFFPGVVDTQAPPGTLSSQLGHDTPVAVAVTANLNTHRTIFMFYTIFAIYITIFMFYTIFAIYITIFMLLLF